MKRYYDMDAEDRAVRAHGAIEALCSLLHGQGDTSTVQPGELADLILLVMEPARDMVNIIVNRTPPGNDET